MIKNKDFSLISNYSYVVYVQVNPPLPYTSGSNDQICGIQVGCLFGE